MSDEERERLSAAWRIKLQTLRRSSAIVEDDESSASSGDDSATEAARPAKDAAQAVSTSNDETDEAGVISGAAKASEFAPAPAPEKDNERHAAAMRMSRRRLSRLSTFQADKAGAPSGEQRCRVRI